MINSYYGEYLSSFDEMKSSFPRFSKPRGGPDKYRAMALKLRRRILCGEFPPGTRLPTRVKLCATLRTNAVTLQKAINLLINQGLIRADGARGTFVADPVLAPQHYALAFPWSRQEDTCQFFRALQQQAEQLTTPHRQITCFHEISGHTDTEDYLRLAGLVRSHRLAGIIFASIPFLVEGLPVLEEPGVPRVMISEPTMRFPVPSVYPDLDGFSARALDAFAAAGRRRVAVITLAQAGDTDARFDKLVDLAAARGLQIQRPWLQAARLDSPYWARHAAELLFQADPTRRPDALLITDDNLVPAATAGVHAAGARAPEDVLVIAHTNFPYPTPAAVPVTRLGFDISHLLELCVERIDQQRRGEMPAASVLLPVVAEEECAGLRVTGQLGDRAGVTL